MELAGGQQFCRLCSLYSITTLEQVLEIDLIVDPYRRAVLLSLVIYRVQLYIEGSLTGWLGANSADEHAGDYNQQDLCSSRFASNSSQHGHHYTDLGDESGLTADELLCCFCYIESSPTAIGARDPRDHQTSNRRAFLQCFSLYIRRSLKLKSSI